MKRLAALVVMATLLPACAAASETAQGWRDRIEEIDVETALDGLRDCDRLSASFVIIVQTGADAVDGLSERTDGRVPETDIREAVDNLAVSNYFEIAERVGCAQLEQRLSTVEQLQELSPETPAGEDFLDEILRQVEAAG